MLSTKPTTILFDLGNTLLYFQGDWVSVYRRALAAAAASLVSGQPGLQEAEVLASLDAGLQAYYRQRDIDLIEKPILVTLARILAPLGVESGEQVSAAARAFYRVTQARWIPEEDAEPVLAELKNRAYQLGVVSNAANDDDVQTLVDKAGIRPYLDLVLSSGYFGRRKPDPAIFTHALESLGARAEETIMVGDTLTADILGANQMGIASVWISRRAGGQKPEGRMHIRPSAEIQALTGLFDWIRTFGSG
jgi:HAD superfamily hydrolase (TIGR01509 family)